MQWDPVSEPNKFKAVFWSPNPSPKVWHSEYFSGFVNLKLLDKHCLFSKQLKIHCKHSLVALVAAVESHFQSFTNQLSHLSPVQDLTSRTQPNPTHFRAFFDRGLTFARSEFCLFLTWCWCFARRWWEVWWAQVEGRPLSLLICSEPLCAVTNPS